MVKQRLGDSGQRLARCISSTFGNVLALSGADGKGHCVAGPAVYNVSPPSIRPGKRGVLRQNIDETGIHFTVRQYSSRSMMVSTRVVCAGSLGSSLPNWGARISAGPTWDFPNPHAPQVSANPHIVPNPRATADPRVARNTAKWLVGSFRERPDPGRCNRRGCRNKF